ncbi:FixH family protein [Ramlibacter albus]|uniref:FixH family protein n=1 Tax=Ramlibacter albus TaxID=2079448 RepID=A0A923M942_9BURK|nr:FixH family protein [Ramlibacter albus]MBC5765946.1 FixH family protein [Ramlibacter albus]
MKENFSRRTLFAAAAGLALLATGCATAATEAGRDYSTDKLTQQGGFRVSWRTETGAPPIGQLHTWVLHVARPDGTPVTDAAIAIDGDMPQHLHGLPTRPRMTRHLGNGDYLIDGIKFQMGGWWVMEFTITAQGRKDLAKFNLMLKR